MAGRGPEGPLHTDARLAYFSTFENAVVGCVPAPPSETSCCSEFA